jgi:pyruvate/2-oxoglutarate dehydrogenase complex dihydrolipoamide acyltransferase (E2) component
VGVIEGQDIAVTGPMSVEVVGGQVKTILRSGSDVRVKSGQARISLVEGGQISICGPAHFSVLKSGGSLTVALESGAIRARLEREPALTVYTAQIQAQSVGIGDDPREILVGFESTGTMCIRTYRGAMRLEQQLSGQSVMVPQGGDVILANGQIDTLRNSAGHCNCELQIAKAPAVPRPESTIPARSEAGETAKSEPAQNANNSAAPAEKPAAKEEPIYEVYPPPLRFDASAKVQPEPDPRLMVFVRRIRVRPTLIFQGRVEGEPVVTAAATPPQPPGASAPVHAPAPPQASVFDRVRSFFRRLW